jgi:hypothetical protein
MGFVNTEHPRKMGNDEGPVRLQVNLLMSPEETRMDRAQRQRQAVVLLHATDHQSVGHAIANQGRGHRVADLIRVAASVRHAGNGSLEILTADGSLIFPLTY